MTYTDKLVGAGALVCGVLAVLAYKGKLHFPSFPSASAGAPPPVPPRAPPPAAAHAPAGGGYAPPPPGDEAPVDPSQWASDRGSSTAAGSTAADYADTYQAEGGGAFAHN